AAVDGQLFFLVFKGQARVLTMAPSDRIVARVLGCGSSGGVPRIGNNWGACDPSNPKNRRRRCSLLITGTRAGSAGATSIVIDTGCGLREQLLDAEVGEVDAVLYTHAPADHTHGIDDLRVLALNAGRRIDVYADAVTLARLNQAFDYCFSAPPGSPYPPILNARRLEPGQDVTVEGEGGALTVTPFIQEHGTIASMGFRIGRFAYSCDLSGIPAESEGAISRLDTWVLDALR